MLNISEKSDLINFICTILNYVITYQLYVDSRADLIIKNLIVEIKQMEYSTTLVVYVSTIGHVIGALVEKYPSAKKISDCPMFNKTYYRTQNYLFYIPNVNDNLSKL